MKHEVDDQLRQQIAKFELRFNCEDCVHFNDARPVNACVHGYPTAPHRRNSGADSIVFCKEFELA